MFQTIRWMPSLDSPYNNYCSRMSQQYGSHHYQRSSAVASDKPWDIVAAAAAAAAASVNNNVKTSANSSNHSNNGFQSAVNSDKGANGGGAYYNNNTNQIQQMVMHQQQQLSPTWSMQPEMNRLYAGGQHQQQWNLADQHQQHSRQQHQHNLQQTQLITSGSAQPSPSAYFGPHRLTSPPMSPLSPTGAGWPKVPQHSSNVEQTLLDAASDNESAKNDAIRHLHYISPQQSPTYLSRNDRQSASYGSLLAASSRLRQLPQNQHHLGHQNHQLPYQHQKQAEGTLIGIVPNTPLYQSSLELDITQHSISNSNNSKSAEGTSRSNFSSPRLPTYVSQMSSNDNLQSRDRNANSAISLSDYLIASREESPLSPHLNRNELEAVKTMLSIQTNSVKDNACDYQQISPVVSENYIGVEESFMDDKNCVKSTKNNLPMSRDDAKAQQHIDVPVLDKDKSSSTLTSAKISQENKEKRGISYDDYSRKIDYIYHQDKLNFVDDSSESPKNAKSALNNNTQCSSGVAVVKSKNSEQMVVSPEIVLSSKNLSSRAKKRKEMMTAGSYSDSSSPENGNLSPNALSIALPSLSSPSSRNGNLSAASSNNSVSGFGLQKQNAAAFGHSTVYNCHICKFSSTSKFHFNSHMNTHADHKCTFCDYTSRTEGRLKRHMKDFHTHSTSSDDMDGRLIINEGDSDTGRCSPPSPDENTAIIEHEVSAVMGSASESRDDLSPAGSQSKDRPAAANKPKNYRCKQCNFVATSKSEFWSHQKTAHIKGDRVLSCSRCSFVTEYKHHLEYHLRNHFGSKPFKCAKCNYSCVNKSMLNSHMKSHSNFYQYRCDDCTYATKYCHSLKMHLRKYAHRPATIINPDGSMSEPSVIDVYGNRRGPRTRKSNGQQQASSSSVPSIHALLPPMSVPTTKSGSRAAAVGEASLTPLMEALQTTYLKQQQELASAMANSIATLGAQLPTVPSSIQINNSSNLIEENNMMSPNSTAASPNYLKCNMCSFETNEGKDVLTVHVMSHIVKKELCNLYGLDKASGATSSRSTPNDYSNGRGSSHSAEPNRLSLSTPKDEARSRSNSFVYQCNKATCSSPAAIRASPSQELSQDSNSPASASYGKNSGDESIGGMETLQHLSRRKGKAYKLDKIALRLQERMSPMTTSSKDDNDADLMDVAENAPMVTSQHSSNSSPLNKRQHSPVVRPKRLHSHSSAISATVVPPVSSQSIDNQSVKSDSPIINCSHSTQPIAIDWSNAYVCNYCEIAFKDCIMYTIHMGYHGFRDPFKCNMCGHVSDGRLSMFLHIARVPHP